MSKTHDLSPKPEPGIIIGNQAAAEIIHAILNDQMELLGKLLRKADIATLELVLEILEKLNSTGELVAEIRGILNNKKAKKPVPPSTPPTDLKHK